MSRLVRACMLGFMVAALPIATFATEGTVVEASSRALPAAADTSTVAVVAVLAVLALFLIASLGYLYRRERHLTWGFQRPDAAEHDAGHH